MVTFCSTVQKLHGSFCVGSLDSQHTVSRFENRIWCRKSEEINKTLYTNEEMGATTVNSH